jgi:alkanesulfonate monooxygenase SsuD/methylene tetrahydromethanopterin reductase-like flavin-dependent oxidoreductase (luciferase family)
MAAPTLGVVFRPQLPPERLRGIVETADAAGLDELWLWEDCFLEGGIATAAMALSWSERIHVGVGLLPVPLRNPALAAMELATLVRTFPGRFRFGLGHGVQDWMEQVGARAASPLTLLDEYVTAVRRLLTGETVTMRGRYVHLTEVALDWPPPTQPAVLIGASGPKTLALAGAVGDGTILTAGTSPDRLREARVRIDQGRAEAGRTADPHPIVVYLLAMSGPNSRDRAASELSGGNVDDLTVSGDAASVAEGVRRWAAAGADTVVLQPLADEHDVEGFVRFVGEDVKAHLDGT